MQPISHPPSQILAVVNLIMEVSIEKVVIPEKGEDGEGKRQDEDITRV